MDYSIIIEQNLQKQKAEAEKAKQASEDAKVGHSALFNVLATMNMIAGLSVSGHSALLSTVPPIVCIEIARLAVKILDTNVAPLDSDNPAVVDDVEHALWAAKRSISDLADLRGLAF